MKVFIALMLSGSFALAPDISGTVLLSNGSPAAGAQVALVGPYRPASMGRATLMPGGYGVPIVWTGQDGHFSLPWTNDATAIIAVDKSGYAEIEVADFEKNSRITLKPWGRVEGLLRVGKGIGTNQQIILQSELNANRRLWLELDAFQDRTDASGKFAFAQVPPGTWTVSHSSGWYGDTVTVKAGETNDITIGGVGRPVAGKFLIPENVAKLRQGPIPPSGWYLDFFEPGSSERAAYLIQASLYGSNHREHFTRIAPDGTIRVEDVTPGKWWLVADLLKIPKDGGSDTTFATVSKEVTVPEISGGRSDEPLDLGDLKPIVVHSPQVGEDAPPLTVKTAEGGSFDLAAHRGQYVLLDFEALYETRKTNAAIEAVWQAYGANERFAMLTLHVPPNSSYAFFSDETNKYTWPVAHLEKLPWYEQKPLRASFGLQCDRSIEPDPNLPAIFLIGPDGKILRTHLRADQIDAAISQFLAKK